MRVAERCRNQDANLFLRLLAASTASSTQAQRLLKGAAGLSITEWRILWDTGEAGPLSIQDIALIQRTDHSLVSRALPAMREKGYITTERSAEDKRHSLVHILPKGRELYERAAPVMKARRQALEGVFSSEDLSTFLALISKFEAYLSATESIIGGPEPSTVSA